MEDDVKTLKRRHANSIKVVIVIIIVKSIKSPSFCTAHCRTVQLIHCDHAVTAESSKSHAKCCWKLQNHYNQVISGQSQSHESRPGFLKGTLSSHASICPSTIHHWAFFSLISLSYGQLVRPLRLLLLFSAQYAWNYLPTHPRSPSPWIFPVYSLLSGMLHWWKKCHSFQYRIKFITR